jgi:tetratricopeptide (TPR) repeat protein
MTPITLLIRSRFLFTTVFMVFALSTPAHADPLQEVSRLIKQGQFSQALEQADKYLAAKPKDAQARFLKGIALTEMNRPNDAIAVFQKLTEDFPELPEPYNNLAVIYAQQKQYDKAKGALEMAIRTHPSYATAHENLGDIYARLASQAYDKALQLDSSNSSAQSKLALIRDLMTSSGRSPAKPATTPVQVAEVRPTEPKLPAPAIAPKPAVVTPEPVKPPVAVAAAKPTEPAKTEIIPANANSEISKAIEGWANAWSRKDVKSYLAFYARDFKVPGGQARSKWETERRQRIEKPKAINVDYDQLKVNISGDKATVRFRQRYEAGAFKATTAKTLEMGLREGKWLILQENVGG